jgi:hypothetical protein
MNNDGHAAHDMPPTPSNASIDGTGDIQWLMAGIDWRQMFFAGRPPPVGRYGQPL